ncbi:hypothetical protein CEXT_51071 [Caerostris extrusa]|uniref:Uncharacterized protein n=1 Tax=Caerostris extrusa TaxID=172846 RepID=A0AAV4MX61_CAEEX|nr:hypothetical protein CEXT_51071 [Caerostris extrusa]
MLPYKIYHKRYHTKFTTNITILKSISSCKHLQHALCNAESSSRTSLAIALPSGICINEFILIISDPHLHQVLMIFFRKPRDGGERQRRGGNICPRELPRKSRR